ncbi:Hypothetical_protein [Hexamita inflata]|uniref:Hypothetical_protein n=1 Tax=Hexamita inflata TaxID=28002 RepID=A0AA86PE34_9EUKA|nr:Hypothetical protein HINF_LOCUS25145 [Hexamita inflata]
MRFVVSFMLSCYTPQASCIDYNLCGTQKITDVTVSCNNAQTCKNLVFNGFEVSMCPFYSQQSDCNNNCGHTCELTYQNVNYSYSTGASKINNSMNGNVWTCGHINKLQTRKYEIQSQIQNSLTQFFTVFKEANIWKILFFEDESRNETLKSLVRSLWRYTTTTAEEDKMNQRKPHKFEQISEI